MANQGINYTARNFADIRSELISMCKIYYPNVFSDFNDASIGMLMIELNASVSDLLNHNMDRMYAETQIDYAQERKSLMSMGRTFGLHIPWKKPSITLIDFTITVPVKGDSFDLDYTPVLKTGTQVTGGGKVFETVNDINFSSPFNSSGIPNRLIVPNLDSNHKIINYSLTKKEIVKNGTTRILKRIISTQDVKPFLTIILPENDVLSIDSVITLKGTSFVGEPSLRDFYKLENRWFEVDALAENKVFIEDNSRVSDNSGVKPGKWVTVNKKFIREYTDLGFTKLTFGSGTYNTESLTDFNTNKVLVDQIGNFINNMSLGEIPENATTMFVKYRIGGGQNTNVGVNILTNLGIVNMEINGSDQNINNSVRKSLKVNNLLPAMGGRDEPSVEEIRNMVKYNFSAQNRAVTLKDYQIIIQKMPSQFGLPFRFGVLESQNKIYIYILGLDENSKLSNQSNSALRENISQYLSDCRMVNDYVKITNGKIINLAFQIDVYVDNKIPQSQIITQIITEVRNYMDINKMDMGDNVYLSPLSEKISRLGGVINLLGIRVYNKVGGKYSLNEISQSYSDDQTREINVSDKYTLFGHPDSMFEIKYPNSDISVRVRT